MKYQERMKEILTKAGVSNEISTVLLESIDELLTEAQQEIENLSESKRMLMSAFNKKLTVNTDNAASTALMESISKQLKSLTEERDALLEHTALAVSEIKAEYGHLIEEHRQNKGVGALVESFVTQLNAIKPNYSDNTKISSMQKELDELSKQKTELSKQAADLNEKLALTESTLLEFNKSKVFDQMTANLSEYKKTRLKTLLESTDLTDLDDIKEFLTEATLSINSNSDKNKALLESVLVESGKSNQPIKRSTVRSNDKYVSMF